MQGQSQNADRGLRLLLIEDDPDHAIIAAHFLGKLGRRIDSILTRENLADARKALATGDFDVAMLDLTLPDSMLDATVEAIPDLAQFGASIIAMSSLDVPEVRARAIKLGAVGFLAKTRASAEVFAELLSKIEAAPAPMTEALQPAPEGTQPTKLAKPASPSEVRSVASKIAHDANSWIANATFRLSVLQRDDAVNASEDALEHLASIGASLDALTKFIASSRSLVIDEVSEEDMVPFELASRLPRLAQIWESATGSDSVQFEAVAMPAKVLATDDALSAIVTMLLENAAIHGEKPVVRSVRFEGLPLDPEGTEATIAVTDNGGGWGLTRIDQLATPAFRGDRRSPRAGLGLYRVKRAIERLGGRIAFEERDDVPGAIRILLTFAVPA